MTSSTQHPEDLLPFYVNNTLDDQERHGVESHIAHCEHCQQELALLKTMHEVSGQRVEPAASEFAWKRLQRDMKTIKNTAQENSKSLGWWKPALAVAAAVVIVVQTVIIFKPQTGNDSYIQAGQQQPGAVVQVKFNPNAREEQIRKVLLDLDVEIIAGPSAAGIYRVRLSAVKDDPAAEEKLIKLREKKLIINYIARE